MVRRLAAFRRPLSACRRASIAWQRLDRRLMSWSFGKLPVYFVQFRSDHRQKHQARSGEKLQPPQPSNSTDSLLLDVLDHLGDGSALYALGSLQLFQPIQPVRAVKLKQLVARRGELAERTRPELGRPSRSAALSSSRSERVRRTTIRLSCFRQKSGQWQLKTSCQRLHDNEIYQSPLTAQPSATGVLRPEIMPTLGHLGPRDLPRVTGDYDEN
jgi:hypothetical protein